MRGSFAPQENFKIPGLNIGPLIFIPISQLVTFSFNTEKVLGSKAQFDQFHRSYYFLHKNVRTCILSKTAARYKHNVQCHCDMMKKKQGVC